MSLLPRSNLTSTVLASRRTLINLLHSGLTSTYLIVANSDPLLHHVQQPPTRPIRRNVSAQAKLKDITKPEGAEEDDLLSSLTKRRGGRIKKGTQKISPKDWLLSEDGLKFRDPVVGRTNWLGGEMPFPTNPWFKPQPPLSDRIRTKVYESFKQRVYAFQHHHPNLPSSETKRHEQLLLRQTSQQWGISRDRVSAIIRLKAMEDSWSFMTDSGETGAIDQDAKKDPRRTLQLNFEKGMESVLGVQRDLVSQVDEDVNELANRRRQRTSKFYGIEFVPLDAPSPELLISSPSASHPDEIRSERLGRGRQKKYEESDEPTETRHIVGPDGLPRPPTCYISKSPSKIPMVFTDVSEFPRAPKPMSKRKAKYYPKTSLLPNYSNEAMRASQTPVIDGRRSNSTLAASSTRHLDSPRLTKGGVSPSAKELERHKFEEEKRQLASQLLRQFKGCASSDSVQKILDDFKTTDRDQLGREMAIDEDVIRETVLLRAGGRSFRKSTVTLESDLTERGKQQTSSAEEKEIMSIKYEMIKSIYLKKLELNSAGRLLLPKAIRTKEEQDLQILSSRAQATGPVGVQEQQRVAARGSIAELSMGSNVLIKSCMKGPLGRIKQRQQASQKNQAK